MSGAPRFLRELVKRVVTRGFNRHRPGELEDIYIFSAPRSGSTWLMEAIYTQPGIKYINEPLTKAILDYNGLLPIRTRWDYLALTASERKILAEYFGRDDRIRHFGPWNIFDRRDSVQTDRRVFKIIRANVARRPEVLAVTYEELVLRPERIFGLLADRLDLPDRTRLLAHARRPSMVTDSSTEAAVAGIRNGDQQRLIGGWAGRVPEEEQAHLFEIVSRFGIRAYTFGDLLPDASLQHFPASRGAAAPQDHA